jgi:hypothetical protein
LLQRNKGLNIVRTKKTSTGKNQRLQSVSKASSLKIVQSRTDVPGRKVRLLNSQSWGSILRNGHGQRVAVRIAILWLNNARPIRAFVVKRRERQNKVVNEHVGLLPGLSTARRIKDVLNDRTLGENQIGRGLQLGEERGV